MIKYLKKKIKHKSWTHCLTYATVEDLKMSKLCGVTTERFSKQFLQKITLQNKMQPNYFRNEKILLKEFIYDCTNLHF